MQRPPRPFGVTLAIFASLILFTCFPLIEVGLLLSVRLHFANLTFADDGTQPLAMGADFLGIPDSKIFLQTLIAIVFLVIAVMAWRGRRKYMRFVLIVSCAGLTLFNILNIVIGQLSQQNFEAGASSLDSVLSSLSLGQFAAGVLVTLYVIWYLNRGPARAFYRGYYLPMPVDTGVPESATQPTTTI
ncbi:MAG: hypothetical protein GC179_00160 [Anaerolineaceae bacterium]|nr:hypothetical protein [Anaerolineaceae bacterium]